MQEEPASSPSERWPAWRSLVPAARRLWAERWFPDVLPLPTEFTNRFYTGLLCLTVLGGVLLLPNLSFPLFEPDEGRRAEIGREIAENNCWLVPTLNQQPYYDKPPLFHWLIAFSLQIFGPHVWAVRLVPALLTMATVLVLYVLGSRILGGRGAFLGSVVFLVSPAILTVGRAITIDILLSLCLTWMFLTAYLAFAGAAFRWRWWLLSALGCALGLLTKGPVVLALFVPPVFLFAWMSRLETRPRWRHWAAYLAVACGGSLPWYGAILLHEPEFAYDFLINHNVRRFLTGIAHVQPFWYYLPVLAIALLPWSFLAVSLGRFIGSREPAVRAARPQALGYFLLWGGWCVLFFSLSRGKLPLYILPALAPLALFIGWFLKEALFSAGLEDWFRLERTRAPVFLMAILGLALPILDVVLARRHYIGYGHVVVVGVICGLGLMAFLLLRQRLSCQGAWGYFLSCLALAGAYSSQGLVPAIAAARSPVALSGELRTALERGNTGVVCWAQDWGSMPFHGQGEIFDLRAVKSKEFAPFMARNERVVIVFPRFDDLTVPVKRAIPADRAVKKLISTRANTFFLVEKVKS